MTAETGWSSRHVNRRLALLARMYKLPWGRWRGGLHQAGMHAASRLLSVAATTEQVAQKCGFRSPASLCHAFAKAGLPSPGVFARAARRDVLANWSEFVPHSHEPIAAE